MKNNRTLVFILVMLLTLVTVTVVYAGTISKSGASEMRIVQPQNGHRGEAGSALPMTQMDI
jgi:hypothetical protein